LLFDVEVEVKDGADEDAQQAHPSKNSLKAHGQHLLELLPFCEDRGNCREPDATGQQGETRD